MSYADFSDEEKLDYIKAMVKGELVRRYQQTPERADELCRAYTEVPEGLTWHQLLGIAMCEDPYLSNVWHKRHDYLDLLYPQANPPYGSIKPGLIPAPEGFKSITPAKQ